MPDQNTKQPADIYLWIILWDIPAPTVASSLVCIEICKCYAACMYQIQISIKCGRSRPRKREREICFAGHSTVTTKVSLNWIAYTRTHQISIFYIVYANVDGMECVFIPILLYEDIYVCTYMCLRYIAVEPRPNIAWLS